MARGGRRIGAGRPKGQGLYQKKTKPMRIPECMIDQVRHYIQSECYQLPLYEASVEAGFPSPAGDSIERSLDLNAYVIEHPSATFFVRASGLSMINAGIHPGDLLVVDRSLEAISGKVVIAAIDGQLTVKRLMVRQGKSYLEPENEDFEAIEIHEENEVVLWGVVIYVIHQV